MTGKFFYIILVYPLIFFSNFLWHIEMFFTGKDPYFTKDLIIYFENIWINLFLGIVIWCLFFYFVVYKIIVKKTAKFIEKTILKIKKS